MTAWSVAVLLAGLLLGVLGVLAINRARMAAYPELSRKLAHVAMGIVALTFPWLFIETGPVLAIAAAALLVLLALRTVPWLRTHVAPVLLGVRRASMGDLYFPLAAAGLFVITRGDPVLYSIPILTLTIADALAAMVGLRYGSVYFATVDGRKSIEGSVAFLVIAFLAAHLTLLLASPLGRVECVLVAGIFAVVVTLLEAVAWGGLDNLFVPLGGYLVLWRMLPMQPAVLIMSLCVAVLLLSLVLFARNRQTLDDSGLLVGVLIGYISWDIGGWRWLLPPLVVFIAYPGLFPRANQRGTRPHDLVALGAVTVAGACWLTFANGPHAVAAYYAYTLAFAATLCFIGVTWFHVARTGMPRWRAVVASAITAGVTLFIPFVAVQQTVAAALLAVAGIAIMAAAAALYTRLVLNDGSIRHPWERQALMTLVASLLGFIIATA